jgi:hypothetical protein
MSTTPRYSAVSLAQNRAAEAAAAAAAERRRLEEERQRRHDERMRQLAERAQTQQQERAAAMRRPMASAAATPQERSDTTPDRRRHARDRRPPRAREAMPVVAPDPQPAHGAVPADAPATPMTPDAPTVPVPLDPAILELAVAAHTAAATLADALEPLPESGTLAVDLRSVAARLDLAIYAMDAGAIAAETAATRDLLTQAERRYDELQQAQARRWIIARGIASALPERYSIGSLLERADGSIRFVAEGPDDDLMIAVTRDDEGQDVVGYKVAGESYYAQIAAAPGLDDCPTLTADLEEAHRRAAIAAGLDFSPITWPGGGGQSRSTSRSDVAARRSTR